jgi:uncharacterized membrane protein YeaQ/YmgE (transglycosylase-associated protein family)
MQVEPLLILLVIGAVAGILAGVIVEGYGFGLVGIVVVGIVGAVIGGWLLPQLGLFPGGNLTGQLISATRRRDRSAPPHHFRAQEGCLSPHGSKPISGLRARSEPLIAAARIAVRDGARRSCWVFLARKVSRS